MDNNIFENEIEEGQLGCVNCQSKNIYNSVELSENNDDGMFFSSRSILFFCTFYLPYLIMIITNVSNDYAGSGFGFFVALGGIFVMIPTIVSFAFGIIAVKKYYKLKANKNKLRKILNVLNIITIVSILPYLCLTCILLLCYFYLILSRLI